jgi:hypothetical protein
VVEVIVPRVTGAVKLPEASESSAVKKVEGHTVGESVLSIDIDCPAQAGLVFTVAVTVYSWF